MASIAGLALASTKSKGTEHSQLFTLPSDGQSTHGTAPAQLRL